MKKDLGSRLFFIYILKQLNCNRTSLFPECFSLEDFKKFADETILAW